MTDITPKQIIEERIPQRLTTNPELHKDLNTVILFDITGPGGGKWVLDLTKDSNWISTNPEGVSPKTTIHVSDADFVGLVTKTLNPQGAAMSGRLKLKPMNAALAMKLGKLLG